MVAFAHTAAGTIIGLVLPQNFTSDNTAAGLITTGFMGLISHYLTDFIPHGHFFNKPKDFSKKNIWVIIFDLLLPFLFIIGSALYLNKSDTQIWYLLFGIGGAQLPDVLEGLKKIKLLPKTSILTAENKFHMSTHWHGLEEKALLFSIYDVWQIALYILAVYLLLFY